MQVQGLVCTRQCTRRLSVRERLGGQGAYQVEIASANIWAEPLFCGSPGTIDAMKKNLTELGFMVPTRPSKPTNQVFLF
jgi:hypothetical protein